MTRAGFDTAREMSLTQVAKQMDAGYRIFAGGTRQWSVLRQGEQVRVMELKRLAEAMAWRLKAAAALY